MKKDVFELATKDCLPYVIRMGSLLNADVLKDHIQYFTMQLKGMPSRLPDIYSVYRFFACEVDKFCLLEL